MKKILFLIMIAGYIQLNAATTESILNATLPSAGGKFGYDVAISGDYAFASSDMITSYVGGKVRVFKKTNGIWAQSQELVLDNTCGNRNKDACQYYGSEIDAYNEWLAIGAPLWDSDCLSNVGPDGSVFIYKRVGETYVLHQHLYDPNIASAQRYGESVSIHGEWLFVGTPNKTFTVNGTTYSSSGVVYIYRYNAVSDLWELFQSVSASDKVSSGIYGPYEDFGLEVEVNGSKAMISDPIKAVNGTNYRGTVYFYSFNGATWTEIQKVSLNTDYRVGTSLAMSGDYAAFGTSSSGKVYVYNYANNAWNAMQTISKSGSGTQISMSGNYLVINDPQFITNYKYTGAADIYKLKNGVWGLNESVYPSDGQQLEYNNFGNDIDVNNGELLVGASLHYNNFGKIYVYEGFANEPAINAGFTPSGLLEVINHNITFTDASIAQFTNITSWKWDFNGDGVVDVNNADNNPVVHQYAAPGVYPVILTVSDGILTSSKTKLITIVGEESDTCFTYLPVQGLESEKMGTAAWNTLAGAPEPQKWGHNVQSPPASIGWAYYYLGSRNYNNIDAQSTGAMHVTDGINGWPNLTQALAANGFTPADISISFGVMTLGNDLLGSDWFMAGNRETRIYKGGTYSIQLKGENMISGTMPDFTMYIDYFAYLGSTDKISGKTGQSKPADNSVASSQEVKNVATAFLADCEHFNLHFLFSSIQTANQFEFQANNRIGGFFEVQQGFILKACACSEITVNAGDTLWTRPNTAKQLNASVIGGNAPYTYSWSPSNGLNNSTISDPLVSLNESQTLTLTVTDARGCTGETTKRVEVVNFAEIFGHVRDIENQNEFIVEAKIKLEGQHNDSTRSSKGGEYIFSNLFPDKVYTIKAIRSGYQDYSSNNFSLYPDQSKEFDLLMSKNIDTGNNNFYSGRNISIFKTDNKIIIRNNQDFEVNLIDISGRILMNQLSVSGSAELIIPNKGIFIIQIMQKTDFIQYKISF